jgi:hypothetical protein
MNDDELDRWLAKRGLTKHQATGRPVASDFLFIPSDRRTNRISFAYEPQTDTVKLWHTVYMQSDDDAHRFNVDDLRLWVAKHGKITPENFDAVIIGAKGWEV